MGDIGSESGAGDANRQRVLDPRLRRITPPDWIASDPLNGTEPAEHRRQQIPNCEVLDLALALSRLNLRSLQETIHIFAFAFAFAFVVVVVFGKGVSRRCKRQSDSRRQYGGRLQDVAASAL